MGIYKLDGILRDSLPYHILNLDQIIFSEQVQAEWSDPQMYENLKKGIRFQNPNVELQVNI